MANTRKALLQKLVIRGLDPRIHLSSQESFEVMDCRVKPGNDGKKLRLG
jgi:hypothetical protein